MQKGCLSPHYSIPLERKFRRPRHVDLSVGLSPLDQQVPPGERDRALAIREAGENGCDDERTSAGAARLSDAAPSFPDHHLHVAPVQDLRSWGGRGGKTSGRGERGDRISILFVQDKIG